VVSPAERRSFQNFVSRGESENKKIVISKGLKELFWMTLDQIVSSQHNFGFYWNEWSPLASLRDCASLTLGLLVVSALFFLVLPHRVIVFRSCMTASWSFDTISVRFVAMECSSDASGFFCPATTFREMDAIELSFFSSRITEFSTITHVVLVRQILSLGALDEWYLYQRISW
jgi:hypothetical protein